MRNFYYVQTYNMMHPLIHQMFDTIGMLRIHDSLSSIKVFSKHFIGFHEAKNRTHEDFEKKLPKIFPLKKREKGEDEIHTTIKVMMLMNPKFVGSDDTNEIIAQKFGSHHADWDDQCCATLFFCESDDEEESFPKTWLVKYEIFFEDDMIELVRKNGEYAFEPTALAFASYTSSIH